MFTDKYSNETPLGPSMETVRARHRAVLNRKCCCGNKRDPGEVRKVASRSWIPCQRCLGSIKQLS